MKDYAAAAMPNLVGHIGQSWSVARSAKRRYPIQRLSSEPGDASPFGGVASYDQHHGFFIHRPFQHFAQESHWTRRMGEGDETRVMKRRQEEAAGNTD